MSNEKPARVTTERLRKSDEPYSPLPSLDPELEKASPRLRAPRISQADVFRAADEIIVAGSRPTIDRVRTRLGRGSPNTINDHLDVWWSKLGERLRDVPGLEFPQLPKRIGPVLQQLWIQALECAHEALQRTLAERGGRLKNSLQTRECQVVEGMPASPMRAVALEDALSLARSRLQEDDALAGNFEADEAHERLKDAVELQRRQGLEIGNLQQLNQALQQELATARSQLKVTTERSRTSGARLRRKKVVRSGTHLGAQSKASTSKRSE